MTTIVVPHFGCNLDCAYCFVAKPVRDKEYKIDLACIKEQIMRVDPRDDLCLHGGEITTIPFKDLEFLLDTCFKMKGGTSIMTNCYSLTPQLVRLFKRYKTVVGISIDGPPSFNQLRGFPSDPVANRIYNKKLTDNIKWLRNEGIPVSQISVLHKANANNKSKVSKLIKWLMDFNLTDGRINLMVATRPEVKKYELSSKEASRAYKQIYLYLREHPELKWNPFREFVDNLLGKPLAPCIVGRCDFFSTLTRTILPDGSIGNCDMTFLLDAYSRKEASTERYDALKETDCYGCPYWEVCGGGCPGAGEDGDWRNKSRFCEAYKTLYSLMEKDLRGLFPNITLSIDIPNYFEDYHIKGKTLVPFQSIEQSSYRETPSKGTETLSGGKKDECAFKYLSGHKHIPHRDIGNKEHR